MHTDWAGCSGPPQGLGLGFSIRVRVRRLGGSTLLSSSPHAVRSVLAEVVEWVMEALAMARVSTPILTRTWEKMVTFFLC